MPVRQTSERHGHYRIVSMRKIKPRGAGSSGRVRAGCGDELSAMAGDEGSHAH